MTRWMTEGRAGGRDREREREREERDIEAGIVSLSHGGGYASTANANRRASSFDQAHGPMPRWPLGFSRAKERETAGAEEGGGPGRGCGH